MKSEHDLYFTLWYGVYQPANRRLDYCCGGHPPAVLVNAGQDVKLLKAKGSAIGFWPNAAFVRESVAIPTASHLYLFSDGAYEVEQPDGTMMRIDDLVQFIRQCGEDGTFNLDLIFQHLVEVRGNDELEDDFSLVRVSF
jgi:sigma-B regulation protein RsbU (phosphoserine phosphatase)